MEFLIEAFPFTFGILLGLTIDRLGGLPARRTAWIGACTALGAFSTLASGEWRVSPLFVLLDIGIVAGVSLAVLWLQRRRAARRAN